MSPQMVRLDEHLQRLRLTTVRERLEALLQDAAEKELSYADFLDGLLSEEVSAKTAKHVTMRTNLARFPFIKGLDSFDFRYQPSVDRKEIQKLSLCHFVEHGENLVLLGPPGVGKTHLAVGLGLKAIEHGYRVLFTTAAAMLTTLTKALSEGRFDDTPIRTRDSRLTISPFCHGLLGALHSAAPPGTWTGIARWWPQPSVTAGTLTVAQAVGPASGRVTFTQKSCCAEALVRYNGLAERTGFEPAAGGMVRF